MSTKREREFLELAKKRLDRCIKSDEHNRKEAVEDLRFLNSDQWDQKTKKERSVDGRPSLTINLLPKFVDQVTGDARHNRPRVKVRPVDSDADIHLAKIREGIIANIEYLSSAETIYDQAMEMCVSCGYGAWRILTRYTEENPFIQEIYLEAIPNPFMVYLDPYAKDRNYSDAEFGFVLEVMTRKDFEKKFPKADPPGDPLKKGQGLTYEHWYDQDNITVAEYFVRKKETVPMVQLIDGRVMKKEDADEEIRKWQVEKDQYESLYPEMPFSKPEPSVIKEKEAEQYKIKHYTITAVEILSEDSIDGEDFPGKFIPLIILKGKERNIEGKTYVRSLIRDAKDPQKMLNYWSTAAAERIALEPKAPWIGTAKQFEGYELDYAQANTRNFPFLKYNIDSDAPPPQRMGPGQMPVALFSEIQRSEENIKSVIGMFNAQLGDASPDRTGAALIQRQKPGDVGTYTFHDNLSKAVAHSGRIINEMIPEVYDTERDVRLRNTDETETFVPVNTNVGAATQNITKNPQRYQGMDVNRLRQAVAKSGRDAKFNDLTVGKYDVVITVGPSYATQRAESAQNLLTLVNSMPKQMALAADLIVENLDFKDADKFAARLRRTLPPGMQPPPKNGEPPTPPLPPPPQVQLAQEKLKLEQQKTALAAEKVKLEKIKVLNEIQQSKGAVKSEIINTLKELHAPSHPADSMPILEGE